MAPDRAYLQARKAAKVAVVAMLSSIAMNATGEATVGPWLGAAGLVLGLYAAHKLGRTGGERAREEAPR
ncbi:MAG: hypothetical protein IT374_16955 [Polyangiaceae bacterium]|nr:hypothetical protein [Polyangiaceae bacterium]